YPIRTGAHFNSAFALALALDYADAADEDLAALIRDKAIDWYGSDRDCPGGEPGGDDFLSPALVEAACMRRVLPRDAFLVWLGGFLPELGALRPSTLFTPASVSDRTDGKIAHLDGLNLSRAWCFGLIAHTLPDEDPRRPILSSAAETHRAVS